MTTALPYSVGGADQHVERCTIDELIMLLRRAEQSRTQLGAFIDQVNAELRGRHLGFPQPAA